MHVQEHQRNCSHSWVLQTLPCVSCGVLVQVHPDGRALQALYDSDGTHVQRISAVTEAGDRLYFGNLAGDYVSFIQKPAETCEQT